MNTNEPQLGDKVRDAITGFKGIAMAQTTWLNGCRRIIIGLVIGAVVVALIVRRLGSDE